jgi:hypothetical protein
LIGEQCRLFFKPCNLQNGAIRQNSRKKMLLTNALIIVAKISWKKISSLSIIFDHRNRNFAANQVFQSAS